MRCTGEELAGAVVATVFASAHADCDNGIAALHESSRPGWHDRRATHRIAVRGLEEAQAILNRPGRLTRGSPHLRTVARVSEAPPKLGLQGLVARILHRLLHSLPRRTELLRREASAYFVEDLGDFLIADVAKQEIVGH